MLGTDKIGTIEDGDQYLFQSGKLGMGVLKSSAGNMYPVNGSVTCVSVCVSVSNLY